MTFQVPSNSCVGIPSPRLMTCRMAWSGPTQDTINIHLALGRTKLPWCCTGSLVSTYFPVAGSILTSSFSGLFLDSTSTCSEMVSPMLFLLDKRSSSGKAAARAGIPSPQRARVGSRVPTPAPQSLWLVHGSVPAVGTPESPDPSDTMGVPHSFLSAFDLREQWS